MTNIVLTAVITFVISGIGGVMFERWLNKAKPLIMINSIKFDNYQFEVIDIGEDSAEIAQSILWETGLQNRRLFYVYEIDRSIRKLKDLISDLESAVKQCEQWMEKHHHESKKRKGIPELFVNDVKTHPIFRHPIISRSIVGDLQRVGAIAYPPESLEKIRASESSKSTTMFDLYQVETVNLLKKSNDNSDSIVFDSGMINCVRTIDDDAISDLILVGSGFSHIFKRSLISIEDQRRKCTTLAESFARCIDDNIFYYTTEFINHSFNEISHLKQLVGKLEDLMKDRLTIFVEVSAYNFGQTATAIDSFMGLKIFHRRRGEDELCFKATTITSSELSSKSEADKEQEVKNRYINLNPMYSCEIHLKLVEDSVSMEEIKALKSTYETGNLPCRLLVKTNSRRTVLTEVIDFGMEGNSKSYEEVKEELRRLKR